MKPFRQQALRGKPNRRFPGGESPGQPSVELHVDELVLHGFSSGDRYAIGDAVERELTRLITMHGLPDINGEGFSVDRIDMGLFQVKQNSRKGEIGTRVAESVYRGLRR